MSRAISDLNESLQDTVKWLLLDTEWINLDLLIYCTYRSPAEQARAYRNGRSIHQIREKANELALKYGRHDLADLLISVGPQFGREIITHAGPGQSLHQYGAAFDAVPMRDGKPVWNHRTKDDRELWQRYGDTLERFGLEWSGRWQQFKEMPHAQQPDTDWSVLIGDFHWVNGLE